MHESEQLARGPMTLEQWADLPEDEPGELVDGRLEEEEMTDCVHEVVVGFLIAMFRQWARPGGLVGGSEAKLPVSQGRGRKPDLFVYRHGDARPPARGVMRPPPGVVVEVVSARPRDARRDRVDKLADYAELGVPYYWIVDPQVRTLEVYERSADGRYVHALSAASGAIRNVPGCAGLAVDLDALWAEVAELEPEG